MQDDPLIGAHLGHFVVEKLIAVGGMGRIYLANHSVIGRTAAIKVLSEKYSSDTNTIKRLHREARAVNQIGHPSIIDIFDFGQTEDRREYFVMEYIPGLSLAQLIAQRGRQPWRIISQVMTQVLDALGAAHDQGIIHRDVKPENILVNEHENGDIVAKVLDFGIAKAVGLGEEGERLTQAGVVLGTPEYIAPEQLKGLEVDGRADLYSMGVILFEMVMGRRPFASQTVIGLLMAHLKEPPPRMDDIPPELGIPAFVPAVVNRAMSKDAEQRYPDARTFARALELQTSAVGPSDGTRPLSPTVWEAAATEPTIPSPQSTLPGVGPKLPARVGVPSTEPLSVQGAPTAKGYVRGAPGAGSCLSSPAAGFVVPTEGIRARAVDRRWPSSWIWIAVLVLLASGGATGGVLFMLRRRDHARPTAATTAPKRPRVEARRPSAETIDIQALYQELRRLLREGTRQSGPEVRRLCAQGLGTLRDSDAFALLVALLGDDPEQTVRAAAALAVGELADPGSVEALRAARGRSSDAMKVWIDEALMHLGSPDGRMGLKDALAAKSRDTRLQAALALGEAGEAAAVPVLAALARDAATYDKSLFMAILGTLAKLGQQEPYKALTAALQQEDRVVRLGAAEALVKLGSEEASTTLSQLLNGADQTIQLVAAKILATAGDYRGLDRLANGMHARDEALRRLAVEGLGRVGDKAAVPLLAEGLRDPQWTVKAAAAESLAHVLALMPSALVQRSQDWIKTALANRDWSVRYAAIGATSEMDPELALSLLSWAAQDADPRVRAQAMARLGRIKTAKARDLLKRGLADADEAVRLQAAQALGGGENVESLRPIVHDKSPVVGLAAAAALLAAGDKTYVKDLVTAAQSRNASIRRGAIMALGRGKSPEGEKLLQQALHDKAPEVRFAAAYQLAQRGNREGVTELRATVERGSVPDRAEALAALGKLDLPPTKELLLLASSASPESRQLAMSSAHLAAPADALALLRKGAADSSSAVRQATALSLSKLAPREAATLPLLQRLARDADPLVRAQASIGLARVRRTYASVAALDRTNVDPVKEAPLPETPAVKTKPPAPKADQKPLFAVNANTPDELYKFHVGKAGAFIALKQFDQALSHLRMAQRHKDTAALRCEFGETYFRFFLDQLRREKKNEAQGYLLKARSYYQQCSAKAGSETLRAKAKAGLRDVQSRLAKKR